MYELEIDLVNRVRNRAVNKGWRNSVNFSDNYDRPCCLLQIMDAVTTLEVTDNEAYRAMNRVNEVMREFMSQDDPTGKFAFITGQPITGTHIATWNDWKHRKFKDVLNLLDNVLSYYMSEKEANVQLV